MKTERRVWNFYQEKLWFQHMWNNGNDFAIRQQFRADFRMTPDTFMDTFTLVRNILEKQDTKFREAFPTEKRVAIAFRISHQRCSTKKDLRPAILLKKRLWRRRFLVNFARFLRTPFLQNTSGRLLLCFMAFSDWEFLPQRFKNICYWKIDCGKH